MIFFLPILGEGNVILIPRDVSIDVNVETIFTVRKNVNKTAESLKINEAIVDAASLTDTRMLISSVIKY